MGLPAGPPAVTTPESTPTVAPEAGVIVQKLPEGVLVNVAVVPIHMLEGPTIAVGFGFTVTILVARQPVANE